MPNEQENSRRQSKINVRTIWLSRKAWKKRGSGSLRRRSGERGAKKIEKSLRRRESETESAN
jgi:hypothetical protein